MNRRGRKSRILVKMAQDRFYACEVCHSDSNVFLETIFKRCGFTQSEMKRAAAQITCPGCESSLELLDYVEPYLHRKEGDQGNAAYWYRRAGKPVCRETLGAEWVSIVRELLG
jgi:hypothetical protein